MIKCKILNVCGFMEAIHGMRNPMNSWDRMDSQMYNDSEWEEEATFLPGDNDLTLMKNLFKAGTEHRKYLRMINVYMDITAPLYWWKEFDTYKVGTVANSCSTMHKIHAKEFTVDDFSHEHLHDSFISHDGEEEAVEFEEYYLASEDVLDITISALNKYRDMYLKTKDKDYWWQMIQLLPSSYNQTRTVMMNYEVVTRIIEQRKNHKLDEWSDFIDILSNLPLIDDLLS